MAIFKPTNTIAYDISSYGTAYPSYVDIMWDKTSVSHIHDAFNYNDKLDPSGNTGVGTEACIPVNLCVPSIHVPEGTRQLLSEITYDANGKPTVLDHQVAQEVRELADELINTPEASLKTSDALKIGDIVFDDKEDPTKLGYNKHQAIQLDDLTDKDFSEIAKTSIPLAEKLQYEVPDMQSFVWKDINYQDLLDKINDLVNKDTDPDKVKIEVSNSELTEKVVDGNGTFDWIASSIYNQLNYAKNQGLLTGNDIAQAYSQTLVQGMQTAAQFALEKNKTQLANLIQLAQIKQANVQALLAQAELIMAPTKLEIQRRQMELLAYQVEVQKIQIHKEAAQTDLLREQAAQAELDRKLKQAQLEAAVLAIKDASVTIKIKEHQADQAEVATQSSLVQLEGLKEDVKSKNAQWQLSLKQIKAADAQIKQMSADIKLKAQQLLKDKEQISLIKAQTASYFAQVTATTEAIKAARAQYSDTIDGVPVGGILGAQIAVNKMQAEAFDRDSYYKFASMAKDGWNAKKTADIATLSPNAFTAFGVDRVMAGYAKHFNLPSNIFELPANYTDYLTDDEMDGTAATPSTTSATV